MYVPDEQGNTIHDASHAGYGGGGIAIPTLPLRETIWPVAGDNTQHIQNAIDYASSLPLQPGGFRGVVDVQDLGVIANHWQQPGQTWTDGDLSRDGIGDIQDLGILANNWQKGLELGAITAFAKISQGEFPRLAAMPEPSSLALFALGWVILGKSRLAKSLLQKKCKKRASSLRWAGLLTESQSPAGS